MLYGLGNINCTVHIQESVRIDHGHLNRTESVTGLEPLCFGFPPSAEVHRRHSGLSPRKGGPGSCRAGACGDLADRGIPTACPFTFLPHSCMLNCMQSTSVRIDVATHEELKRLAAVLGTTVGDTVALAVRRLRQDRLGEELATPLTSDEAEWLDAELG